MDVEFIKKLNDLAKNLRQHDATMSSNEAIDKASKMLKGNESYNEMRQTSNTNFNDNIAKRFNINPKVEQAERKIEGINERIVKDRTESSDFFSRIDNELKKLEPKKNIINYLLFNDLKKINPKISVPQKAKLEVKKELELSMPKPIHNANPTFVNKEQQTQNTNNQTSNNNPANTNNKTNTSARSVDLFDFFNKGKVSSPSSPQKNTNQNNTTNPVVNNNQNLNNNTNTNKQNSKKVDLFDFFNKK
ncbi:MAG: hypothetical protein PHT94_03985 [Candidatus Nanoarchaeia archaeon]|nr:hypothetical protein [Candidatus Nanoarchaeia archaeon]